MVVLGRVAVSRLRARSARAAEALGAAARPRAINVAAFGDVAVFKKSVDALVRDGIVMREGGAFAYLWDPAKQATAAVCKVGDAYAGGVIEAIEERRVIVRGADGPMDLRLDDPKP